MRSNYMLIILLLVAVGEARRCTTPAPKKTWTVLFQSATEEYRTIDESYFDDERFKECIKTVRKTYDARDVLEPEQVYGRKKRDMLKYMITKGGVFPVLISTNWSDCEIVQFANAMKHFEQRTCISFVPFVDHVSTPKPLLVTSSKPGCHAYWPARSCSIDGVPAPVCDKINCGVRYGTVSYRHEIAHTLGMIHEHQSPWREGPAAAWTGFTTQSNKSLIRQQPWDIDSISSYFGNDVRGLSDWDAYKINQIYNCTKTTRGGVPIDMNKKPEMPYQFPELNTTTWVGADPNNCNFKVARGNNTVRFNAGTLIIDDRNNTRYMAPNYNYSNPYFCAVGRYLRCLVGLIHYTFNDTKIGHLDYTGRVEMKSGCVKVPINEWPQIGRRDPIEPDTAKEECSDVIYMNKRTSCVIW